MKKRSFIFVVIIIYLAFLPWGCSKKSPRHPTEKKEEGNSQDYLPIDTFWAGEIK